MFFHGMKQVSYNKTSRDLFHRENYLRAIFILLFTLIISSKIIYKGTSLSLCLQHVTAWRGNTAGFIIENIIWHFKNDCAHYCQASKENILTKENKLLHCLQKPVLGFFFFSVRFTFF